jgi:23S rRNA pseudouridine1911/1915/1917 synthase
MTLLPINDILNPQILAAENDFLLVYKPPRMHSAPEARSTGGETILDWCAARFPEVALLPGRKAGEGGLLHRLDCETHGLMLIARNSKGMEAFLGQQKAGNILKEYSALTAKNEIALPGFPKETPDLSFKKPQLPAVDNTPLFKIESAFKPYGPGRKAVRPVPSGSTKMTYSTEIFESRAITGVSIPNCFSFRLRIRRGFRHQIRCHLAWLGLPILNDNLYGGLSFGNGLLALRAVSIAFNDPPSGLERIYSIPAEDLWARVLSQ